MKKKIFLFVLSLWAIAFIVSCDESTIVGGDILNDEAIDVVFTDTTTIHTGTILGRPINSGRLNANTYMVGVLNDPVFGTTTSDLYLGIQVLDDGPNFRRRSIDSMVLAIAFDTSGFYGEKDAVYDFRLFRTSELIKEDTTFSDETLPLQTPALTTINNKFISPDDTLNFFEPVLDSLVTLVPHFRLPIFPTLGINIFDQVLDIEDDVDLLEVFPALYLEGIPDRSAMMGLSVGNSSRLGDFNKLLIYMKDSIDNPELYEFRFRIDRFSNFEHDYTGSPVEQFIDGTEEAGDSLFFVQGMAGLNGTIDISAVQQYSGFLINKAEIELTVAEMPEYDLENYPPISIYGANYELESGSLLAIQDLDLIREFGFEAFGGELFEEEINGEKVMKLKFNVTNHVKNYIENPMIGSKIVLNSLFDSETPNRTVFYGAGHSKYPAKLNISFTKP